MARLINIWVNAKDVKGQGLGDEGGTGSGGNVGERGGKGVGGK